MKPVVPVGYIIAILASAYGYVSRSDYLKDKNLEIAEKSGLTEFTDRNFASRIDPTKSIYRIDIHVHAPAGGKMFDLGNSYYLKPVSFPDEKGKLKELEAMFSTLEARAKNQFGVPLTVEFKETNYEGKLLNSSTVQMNPLNKVEAEEWRRTSASLQTEESAQRSP